MQKKIITYQVVCAPHTGHALSGVLKSQLLSWNIDKKLFAITVDNASNNNVMIGDLKDWLCSKGTLCLDGALFHVRCSAHIMNLIVQDGLDKISNFIYKIRESVRYTKKSQAKHQNFLNALAHTKLHGKGVSMDVPTRWNSTYEMLRSAIEVRQAFVRLEELVCDYECLPSEEEWDTGVVICECLKVFYDITLLFSGVKYPTANYYFKSVCKISMKINQWLKSEHACVVSMALPMKEKFEKYWSTCSLFMCIGVVLDPCCKMDYIEYAFGRIYGEKQSECHVKKVQDSLKELYCKYAMSDSSTEEVGAFSVDGLGSSSGKSFCQGSSELQEGFKEFIKHRLGNSQVKKTELEKYLEEDVFPSEGKGFDILQWWKSNGPKFPILAKIARDVLAVPVSSVASESAFSAGGRIISDSRSKLGADAVEALVCLRDWLPLIDGEPIVDT